MPLPIISVAQMREWEKATWATGQTEATVIALVGRAIAERLLQLTPAGTEILVLAGKGHNGDDAKAAIAHLSDRKVTLLNVIDPEAALTEVSRLPKNFAFIVDGLFGIGLSRPLNDSWQKLIAAINDYGVPILSIDVPSGLNGDTGKVEGSAIRASVTLTVGAPKLGMVFSHAVPYVGRLETVRNIGLVPPPHQSELNWITAEDFRNFPPPRPVIAHKGSFGHLAIVAGSVGYHGAAVLCARGALRAQPGLVSVFTPENVYVPVASQLQAAMVHPWKPGASLPANCTALLFGPGLASKDLPAECKSELQHLWQTSPLPVIVDASALDWIPNGRVDSHALRVITPHPGEAARKLNCSTDAVQSDRVASLRELSRRYGKCWVVLKGHQTLIGRDVGGISINPSGNPYLAQGGSGDLLAGLLAGLMAQPTLQTVAEQTLRYGVWRHGSVADQLNETTRPWTVEELASVL
ncbi:MAG: Bifunctional NAD(P)H-hydrate repair enzyme [Verrucomicrobiales bacterium]|nr:Bifunctional NAD(P)H-hydrate repair enzyme [Verrucomicrobiales bacterium]